jgi:hypothetical protein
MYIFLNVKIHINILEYLLKIYISIEQTVARTLTQWPSWTIMKLVLGLIDLFLLIGNVLRHGLEKKIVRG